LSQVSIWRSATLSNCLQLDPNSSRLSCVVFPALCFVQSAGMSSRKTLRDSKGSAALIPVPLLKNTRA
jgi:hypothetical protein